MRLAVHSDLTVSPNQLQCFVDEGDRSNATFAASGVYTVHDPEDFERFPLVGTVHGGLADYLQFSIEPTGMPEQIGNRVWKRRFSVAGTWPGAGVNGSANVMNSFLEICRQSSVDDNAKAVHARLPIAIRDARRLEAPHSLRFGTCISGESREISFVVRSHDQTEFTLVNKGGGDSQGIDIVNIFRPRPSYSVVTVRCNRFALGDFSGNLRLSPAGMRHLPIEITYHGKVIAQ